VLLDGAPSSMQRLVLSPFHSRTYNRFLMLTLLRVSFRKSSQGVMFAALLLCIAARTFINRIQVMIMHAATTIMVVNKVSIIDYCCSRNVKSQFERKGFYCRTASPDERFICEALLQSFTFDVSTSVKNAIDRSKRRHSVTILRMMRDHLLESSRTSNQASQSRHGAKRTAGFALHLSPSHQESTEEHSHLMKEHIIFPLAGIGIVHHFYYLTLNFTLFSTMLQIIIFTRP